ncbi:MAG TPA: hypothetical protein VI112_14300 [Bacteroidia bacterium]|jgi:hypothetical protein
MRSVLTRLITVYLIFHCSCASTHPVKSDDYSKENFSNDSLFFQKKIPETGLIQISCPPNLFNETLLFENSGKKTSPQFIISKTKDTLCLILHREIGAGIDLAEKNTYKVLPYLSNYLFLEANILYTGDSTLILRVKRRNNIRYDTLISVKDFRADWDRTHQFKTETDPPGVPTQDFRVLYISPIVGSVLSKREKEYFNILPSIKTSDFISGFYFKNEKNDILFRYLMKNGKTYEKPVDEASFLRIREAAGPDNTNDRSKRRTRNGIIAGGSALACTGGIIVIVAIITIGAALGFALSHI